MQICGFAMVKFPEPHQVKGRLAKSVGLSVATDLYRNFVLDAISTFKQTPWPIYLACHPPEAIPKFKAWLGKALDYFPQKGRDLGERLKNGFAHLFKMGYKKVISIATDCPDLPIDIILEAENQLDTHDAVIGPSPDGGYYLIGFQVDKYLPEFFNGIAWSTDSVFDETFMRMEEKKYRVFQLPLWLDIDTFDDLKRFYSKNQATDWALNTMSYLREHPVILKKQEN